MARIDDGFPTFFDFSVSSPTGENAIMWEKSVTPPGIQAGGETDVTTMRNTVWRTRSPKKLKTLSNMSCTVAYDTKVFDPADGMNAIIGVNQQITATFPDGSTVKFWGWLDEFTPNEVSEGEQPTAAITIIPSNHNGTGKTTGTETGPTYTEPSATGELEYAKKKAMADVVESQYTKPVAGKEDKTATTTADTKK